MLHYELGTSSARGPGSCHTIYRIVVSHLGVCRVLDLGVHAKGLDWALFLDPGSSDKRLLFLNSFSLVNCGDGLFKCEGRVKLQLLGQFSVLDTYHNSIPNHLIVECPIVTVHCKSME